MVSRATIALLIAVGVGFVYRNSAIIDPKSNGPAIKKTYSDGELYTKYNLTCRLLL